MRYKIDTIEPFWWGLFMAGAGIIGMFLPIHILIQGIFAPVGVVSPRMLGEHIATLIQNPLVKLYLMVLISLPLYHWAHRFRYFVFDLGLRGSRMAIAVLCYGAAVVGTILAAIVLFKA